jgi:magnesium-transporting ATPase (P-type)
MLKMLKKLEVDVEQVRKKHIFDPMIRFQFNSKRKRMSTVINNCDSTEFNHDARCHIKGAAEIVLDCCSGYLNESGQRVPLNDGIK